MIFILSFAAVIKEYLQLAEKVIKIFFFSRDVFVKLYLLYNFYQNLTVWLQEQLPESTCPLLNQTSKRFSKR